MPEGTNADPVADVRVTKTPVSIRAALAAAAEALEAALVAEVAASPALVVAMPA